MKGQHFPMNGYIWWPNLWQFSANLG